MVMAEAHCYDDAETSCLRLEQAHRLRTRLAERKFPKTVHMIVEAADTASTVNNRSTSLSKQGLQCLPTKTGQSKDL